MYGLELVEANPPDPLRSEVMSLAAQYRDEGMSPSQALSEAWTVVRGSPWDWDEDDEDDIDSEPKSKKRRRANMTENPIEGLSIGTMLLVAAVGYFVWCGIKSSQGGGWTWTPWKQTVPLARQIRAPIVNRPGVLVTGNHNNPIYTAKNFNEETISLIVP